MFQFLPLPLFIIAFLSHNAFSFVMTGNGHYGLRPKTQTNPGFYSDTGMFQATEQSMSLMLLAKASDKLELHLNLQIFSNPRAAYLGDSSKPETCTVVTDDGEITNTGTDQNCEGKHQDTSYPGYKNYVPQFSEVFVRYGFDFCLLEVGRRGRDWGMGAFLDSGREPFDKSQSLFDGASCHINIQKSQTLAMMFGFDKITETGKSVDQSVPQSDRNGAFSNSDDLDQVHFSVLYDNRESATNFRRQVGIYVSNIFGSSYLDRGTEAEPEKVSTDVKFADLYTAFYTSHFTFRNEAIFRLGKSSDPSWTQYGGVSNVETEEGKYKNDLTSIALAGDIKYQFGREGGFIGPKKYNEGDASWHEFVFDYAYAPGDRDGYIDQAQRKVGSSKVSAVAFHRNFKPALIFFNSPPNLDYLRVDGIFDPDRVMNANVFGLAYKYKSLEVGNYSFKFISATLNKSMGDAVKNQIHEKEAETSGPKERRPIGFSGKHLGYELDLQFDMPVKNYMDFGIDIAAAFPGNAWKNRASQAPDASYLLQGHVNFNF